MSVCCFLSHFIMNKSIICRNCLTVLLNVLLLALTRLNNVIDRKDRRTQNFWSWWFFFFILHYFYIFFKYWIKIGHRVRFLSLMVNNLMFRIRKNIFKGIDIIWSILVFCNCKHKSKHFNTNLKLLIYLQYNFICKVHL